MLQIVAPAFGEARGRRNHIFTRTRDSRLINQKGIQLEHSHPFLSRIIGSLRAHARVHAKSECELPLHNRDGSEALRKEPRGERCSLYFFLKS